MWLWLVAAWSSPIVRKVTYLVGAVLLVGGLFWYTYRAGKSTGKQQGKQEATVSALDQDRAIYQRDRLATAQALQDAVAREQEAAARWNAAEEKTKAAAAAIKAALSARAESHEQVARIPDEKLFADVTRRLEIRAPEDATLFFNSVELRKIDTVLAEQPAVEAENRALDGKIAALEVKLNALAGKVDAVAQQRDAALRWANEVEGLYVKAYNAVPRKRNWLLTIVTFGLKGKPKKLDLPAPLELEKRKPPVS